VRIISGIYKGRQIRPPAALPVRPTTDFAKEGLFNVLNNLVVWEDTCVVDLFAGTGNMTFEFYSRGCPAVTAVDIEKRCTDFIGLTAKRLEMTGVEAIRSNVYVFLKRTVRKANLVFADPPYEMEGIKELPGYILDSGILEKEGLMIIEHPAKYSFADHPSWIQKREYGKVNFSFFRAG
jgi:16S rRNA (guanine(966)-N(2))-methyltransferase RsmD